MSVSFTFTSFQDSPYKVSYQISRTVDYIDGQPYQMNLITIQSNANFGNGAGYWKMCVSDGDFSVPSFKTVNITMEEEKIFGRDSTSRLLGYFTTDAFALFYNQKVNIQFGYTIPSQTVAKDIIILREIKPLDFLSASIKAPELTNEILDKIIKSKSDRPPYNK